MKIDVGRSGPASAMRCDIHLEGEDDPPLVRIYRNGSLASEIAVNLVSDPETLAREVEKARRLEAFPVRLHAALTEMAGDYAGMPDDGAPEKRRRLFASGFLAALRDEKPEKQMPQSWLKGYESGLMLLREANGLTVAFRDQRERPAK